jgi:hypothetical protein
MDEKQILGQTLKKFPTVFGGGLGMLNIKPVSLELIDGEKPYHARTFPVPQSLEVTTKTKMERLTDIDVFNRVGSNHIYSSQKKLAMCES